MSDRIPLREARTAARFTMGHVARSLGLSVTAVSRIENGKLSPSLETVHAMEDFLDQGPLVWPRLSDGVRAQLRVVELEDELIRLKDLIRTLLQSADRVLPELEARGLKMQAADLRSAVAATRPAFLAHLRRTLEPGSVLVADEQEGGA